MEMTGERQIAAPRQTVWEGLNEPEVLRASIPGCESIERTEDGGFSARVAVKIGPMAAKFTGKVRLENLNPPAGYTISGEGNGGAMGFAKGGADVQLAEAGAGTLLSYQVKAQVGGKMAQLGARLIDATAKQMADQFFDRFAAQMTASAAAAASPAAPADAIEAARAGVPVAGTDTEYLAHPGAPAPITHHGAEGISASGDPVARPGPRPTEDALVISPLRTLLMIEPFGLPLTFWGGSVIMLIIILLMFAFG
ncbi:SRPBCC family protein [Plastoroseomonas hellenica]|uniref:SRPBCC family protein n=1 Tax=Plastoroseomonas hellenica TaxID=2687306 RepID=UPI001BABB3CA|nr:carbon monoxide dehydrogenase subunit G [Plastoroseomonas hellenica]MBR0643956.1 carbon monoxide dehydrogenase subunit G [Plastoroseomonas hellenica]